MRGSQVYFSPLTLPCHVPAVQTLEQQCQSQSFLFQYRETSSPTGGWSEMWARVIPASSAELFPNMTLSFCLIQQSWLIFSSSQCHCHLYYNILWINKNVQLCLKQLFGEEKHTYRKMVSCESFSQTTWHRMAQTEGSPNIQRWNVTDKLNCIVNWGQLNKMHFKVSVWKCISFKTKYVRHPYRVP